MNNFLGSKTQEQIKMIKAIVMLKDKGVKSFSAKEVSEKCGIPSRDFGGAFKALANQAGEYGPLVLKAGRKRVDMTNDERRYLQLWRINPKFDWKKLEENLEYF